MKYENLLACRYIKAQKRQSVFTCVSIIAAVAVMTMIFLLYGVFINCYRIRVYNANPYHLMFSKLTEEQGEALQYEEQVRSVKLQKTQDGTVTAWIQFDGNIGDGEMWLQTIAQHIGAVKQFEKNSYQWNTTLMRLDGIGDEAYLFKLRIFCMFFIFAILVAFALRMIIDTAFEVSSKERERHYGVLQSIGATPEQIVRIITYEGMRLCVIAVPFGLIAGIVLAYLMYHVLLKAGLAELFQGMNNAKLNLPFSVDPKMLLVAAVVGIVWVFLSAYGVGMRIIKKTPMDAITTRANNVEKVKKRTLSGLLFGISGSIASRNARRQKKRFAITVLTLTVSATMFALFSALTETLEHSLQTFFTELTFGYSKDVDYSAEIGSVFTSSTYQEAAAEIADSGLFKNIALSASQRFEGDNIVRYVNREAYAQLFGNDPAVSYDELVRTGGYVLNLAGRNADTVAAAIKQGTLHTSCRHITLPADLDVSGTDYQGVMDDQGVMGYQEVQKLCETEVLSQEIKVIGQDSVGNRMEEGSSLFAAIETYDQIADEWFGDSIWGVGASFSYNSEKDYNSADHKTATDWFMAHSDHVSLSEDFYSYKLTVHNVMSALSAGVLLLNVLIALTALINLMNIISTGIANRRSELASLQCVGMTDRQLNRMAVIECLQFTGAAAILSALFCALVIFGSEFAVSKLIEASLVGNESEEYVRMLKGLLRLDHVIPFVRIAFASLAAFAAGCITSLVMLRTQNKESLSDQVRGFEMKPDTKKSHILRNSILAVAGAFVLVITGLRIYSVAAYHRDRNEYAKAGYLNLVDGADNKINVYSTGAEHGRHTIVGLAGMGVNCFPVFTKELNERLGKENTLVYPDRAGYGFSDDSLKEQTLEQVVEDYRAGLKNAGYEAPYVLMPHSYGSFYTLWWQANYPDEVEAIIFLDCTWVTKNDCWELSSAEEYPEGVLAENGRRQVLRTWLGLDRLFPVEKDSDSAYGKSIFSEEELALRKRTENRFVTAASLSETLNEADAARELREILKPTDTPKLYFSTMYTCEEDVREVIEFQNADIIASGKTPKLDPETAAKAEWQRDGWEYQDIYENTLTPFLEQCGNYRLVPIAGDHGLFYAQKPDEVADTILDFLAETTE